ncbi:MAG: hypothetical protein ACM3H8_07730 [Sphingobacteriales bacterium]
MKKKAFSDFKTTQLNQLKKTMLYSEELGIDLKKKDDNELFKWFLASVLLGAMIQESVAKRTWHSFEKHKVLTPQSIVKAGWDYLVNPVMREGHYVRYDEKTSAQLLNNCYMLIEKYNGSLTKLIEESTSNEETEKKLMEFYGIGPVRTNIFLRELRPYYRNCNPQPLPLINQVAKKLGIRLNEFNRKSKTFSRIEAGLIRERYLINKNKNRSLKAAELKTKTAINL